MVVLLLSPAVTEALQQMHHFGHDFINSTVCFKKNKNKIPNPEPSLPFPWCCISLPLHCCSGCLALSNFGACHTQAGWREAGWAAAFPCSTFSTCQTWHTLGLICTCKAKQSSAFGVPYLSESRAIGTNSATCSCKHQSRSV